MFGPLRAQGLPCLVAQTVKNLPAMQEMLILSLVGKILWGREWQPTPVLLPGESHGQRSWRATVHGVPESAMTEMTRRHMTENELNSWVGHLVVMGSLTELH